MVGSANGADKSGIYQGLVFAISASAPPCATKPKDFEFVYLTIVIGTSIDQQANFDEKNKKQQKNKSVQLFNIQHNTAVLKLVNS